MSAPTILTVLLMLSACDQPPEATPSPTEAAEATEATKTTEATTAAAPADRGAEVFAANCASCHGPEGRGDGPAAAGLEPPAADLVGPRASHLKGIPRRTIIEEGRPGTAMVGWKSILSAEDLDAVYGVVHEMKHGEGTGKGKGKGRGGHHGGQ